MELRHVLIDSPSAMTNIRGGEEDGRLHVADFIVGILLQYSSRNLCVPSFGDLLALSAGEFETTDQRVPEEGEDRAFGEVPHNAEIIPILKVISNLMFLAGHHDVSTSTGDPFDFNCDKGVGIDWLQSEIEAATVAGDIGENMSTEL